MARLIDNNGIYNTAQIMRLAHVEAAAATKRPAQAGFTYAQLLKANLRLIWAAARRERRSFVCDCEDAARIAASTLPAASAAKVIDLRNTITGLEMSQTLRTDKSAQIASLRKQIAAVEAEARAA